MFKTKNKINSAPVEVAAASVTKSKYSYMIWALLVLDTLLGVCEPQRISAKKSIQEQEHFYLIIDNFCYHHVFFLNYTEEIIIYFISTPILPNLCIS